MEKIEKKKAYIGIDIGKRRIYACIMDKDGKVLINTRFANRRADILVFAEDAKNKCDCEAACESTARQWIKTCEVFWECGIPIKLANPLRLKLSQSGRKTDKIDAKKLANRLRMNDIPTCFIHPPEETRIRFLPQELGASQGIYNQDLK